MFRVNQTEEIKKFLDDNDAKYYAIRSKEIVGCKQNNFKVPKDKVMTKINKFNLFSINVSSFNYVDNLVLIGDIMVSNNNDISFIGSTNKNFTGKMAEKYPKFNYYTDIFDKRLNMIPKFDQIYEYIVMHDLIDVIVEFAIYDCQLGIYKEPIIIFEIRTEF